MKNAISYLKMNLHKNRRVDGITLIMFVFAILFITMLATSQSSVYYFNYLGGDKYAELYAVNIGDEGREKLAALGKEMYACQQANFNDLRGSVIDRSLAKLVRVPLRRGHWFSEEQGGNQAVVNFKHRNTYQLGKTYDLYNGMEQVKIVGYLDVTGYIISPGGNFGAFIPNGDILICSQEKLKDANFAFVHLTEQEKDQFANDKDINMLGTNLRESFLSDSRENKDMGLLYLYIALAAVGLVGILILQNVVIFGDMQKRRRAISVMCGATRRDIVLAEGIKSVLLLAAAILISLVFALLFDFLLPNEIFPVALNRFGFGVLGAVIAVAVIAALNLLSVFRQDILRTLKRS